MSEKFPSNHEQHHEAHHEQPTEASSEHAERHLASAESIKHSHEKQKENLEHARHEAEIESKSAEQIAEELKGRKELNHHGQPSEVAVTREIKEMAAERLLIRARRHLSPPARAMSRIIHQPVVDAISEVTGKTVARPSGILGGGVVAFLGTSFYYYIAKHYGYNYNAFVFLLLLVLGFAVGWTVEIAHSVFKKR
jgi:flagellar biosynthesis GTPase FlhF